MSPIRSRFGARMVTIAVLVLGGEWVHDVLDGLGNRVQAVERVLPPTAVQHLPIGGQSVGDKVTINYTYDDLCRLTNASYSTGGTYTYACDKVGNRTAYSSPDRTRTYQYDDANCLMWVDSAQYTYDPRGSLTNGGTRTYTCSRQTRDLRIIRHSIADGTAAQRVWGRTDHAAV